MNLSDKNGEGGRWTHGTGGVGGRFGGAHPSGHVNLYDWTETNELTSRSIKCRSYRRAVRLLRMHLKGYTV